MFTSDNVYTDHGWFGITWKLENGVTGGDDVVIENNTIVDIGFAAIYIDVNQSGNGPLTNFKINNNLIYHSGHVNPNSASAIIVTTSPGGYSTNDVVVTNNLIHQHNSSGSDNIHYNGNDYSSDDSFDSFTGFSNLGTGDCDAIFVNYLMGNMDDGDMHLTSADTCSKDNNIGAFPFIRPSPPENVRVIGINN